jgi:hypothetical protein
MTSELALSVHFMREPKRRTQMGAPPDGAALPKRRSMLGTELCVSRNVVHETCDLTAQFSISSGGWDARVRSAIRQGRAQVC